MSKITIYLHIGATKTGSTALQRFLEYNAGALMKEFGVLYPKLDNRPMVERLRNRGGRWQGSYFESTDGSDDINILSDCIEYCKRKSLKAIVISHEAFLVNWHERMGRLVGKLDADIKIICYVRRQDHHLESAWKQWGHKFAPSQRIMESLSTQAELWGGWRLTDWHELLLPWARQFGRENIIVRPYEKQQMGDGVLADFLKTIRVDWPGKPALPENENANTGLSRDAAELLSRLALNKDDDKDGVNQRLHNIVYRILYDHYRNEPFESHSILSPAERLEILNEYENSNQLVARNYLAREDGRLFYEPWPNIDETWEPYEGLTLERAVPIVVTLLHGIYIKFGFYIKVHYKLKAWGKAFKSLARLRPF
jgi:hypothetical protein